jgi:hypothetical protein
VFVFVFSVNRILFFLIRPQQLALQLMLWVLVLVLVLVLPPLVL